MRVRTIRAREAKANDQSVDVQRAVNRERYPTFSKAEAARYIGMSGGWLKKSRTRRFREITDAPPFIRAGARRIVYRREDLDAWQQRHRQQVGPDMVLRNEAPVGIAAGAAVLNDSVR